MFDVVVGGWYSLGSLLNKRRSNNDHVLVAVIYMCGRGPELRESSAKSDAHAAPREEDGQADVNDVNGE
jgi:hypothetical protein